MHAAFYRLQVIASLAFLVSTSTPVRLAAQPVIRAEPVVVSEASLLADAAGVSQIQFAPTTPTTGRTLLNVAENVANLHLNAGGAGSFGDLVSLRGLSNTPYFSDPSVAVYFDDLPLGSAFTYPTLLFGFSSVTVARGPQPGRFGRAAEGGVITFSSPEGGAQPAGELRADIGNFNAQTGAFAVRTARAAAADASVSGAFTERDGYIVNSQLGTRVDAQRDFAGAARVRVRPTRTSAIALQLLGVRRRDGAQPLVPLGGPLFRVARGREGGTKSDFAGGALKLSFDTIVGRLSSTTSRTSWTLDPYDNRLVLPPTLDSRLTQSQRAWNEELRLASSAHAAVSWHVGTWFSDAVTDGDANRSIPGLFPIEVSAFTLTSRTAALFGQSEFRLNDAWQITTSARLERTKKDFDRSQRVPAPGRYTAARTFDAVLPKVAATYTLGADTHATASLGFGRKPGGWSAYTDKPALAAFRAEKAAAFELGVDTLLAARTVQLAARLFDYEIRDYQIERSFNATDYLVVNAPRARSRGGEFELAWKPGEPWTITATLGTTDITLRDFNDPFTGTSYAGQRAPYTPDYDAHLAATYRFARRWFATLDATAVGRTYFDESETGRHAAPARVTENARFGYVTDRWQVVVHAENIGDVGYTTLVVPGVGHAVPGAPRTYGIELAVLW